MTRPSFCGFIAALLLSFFCVEKVNAQCYGITATETALVPSTSQPVSTLSVCSPYKFVYQLTTSASSVSDNITINLPVGVTFSSLFSFSGASVTTSSSPGTASPVFSVSGWTSSTPATITLMVSSPPCNATGSAITTISGTNSCAPAQVNSNFLVATPALNVTNVAGTAPLILNTGTVQEVVFKLENLSGSVDLPQINVSGISPDPSVILLGNYYLSVSATSAPGNNIYTYNYPTPVAGSISGNTPVGSGFSVTPADFGYFFPNNALPPNGVLYLHIPFKVNSCASGGGSFAFNWSCGSTSCSTPITVAANVDVPFDTNPQMGVSGLVPFNNATFCSAVGSAVSQIGFIYQNNGTPVIGAPAGAAKATNLKLYLYSTTLYGTLSNFNLSFGSNPPVPVPTSIITASTLVYSSVNYSIYEIDLSALPVVSNNWSPLGAGNTLADIDGDGWIDDVAEGGNFTITADFTYNTISCPLFASCGGSQGLMPFIQSKYENQCFDIAINHPGDVRIIPYSITNTGQGYYYGTNGGNGTMSAPNDVLSGPSNAFNTTICTNNYGEMWGPTGFDFNCPNGYHQIKMPLPPGFHLATAGLTFVAAGTPGVSSSMFSLPPITIAPRPTCTSGSATVTPTIQEFCPSSPTSPGYILIKFGRLPVGNCGPWNETYLLPCFNVPLFVDCSGSANGCTSVNGDHGADNLSYTLEYICDASCSSCVSGITCGNTVTYHHCQGLCYSYFSTDQGTFKFERRTLGYVNTPTGTYYDNCTPGNATQPLLTNTSPTIDLSAAYPGDVIEATAKGSFTGTVPTLATTNSSNYSDIYFQVRYNDLPSGTSANQVVFDFDQTQGYVTITNVTNPAIFTEPASAMTMSAGTSPGSRTHMNFNLSAAAKAFMSSSTDQYTFDAHIFLIVKSTPNIPSLTTFFTYGPHPLFDLRAEFMGTRTTAVVDSSCDSWGAPFRILQPSVGFGYYPDVSYNDISHCTNYPVSFRFTTRAALWGTGQQDFPNEFRNYAGMDDTLIITLPPGYNYLSSAFITMQSNYTSNASTNNFTNSQAFVPYPITPVSVVSGPGGTTITYKGLNNNCWPLLDPKSPSNAESENILTITMRADCDAPAIDYFRVTGGFTQCTQQSNSSYQIHTSINPTSNGQFLVKHANPVVSVLPPTTVVDVFSNIAVFDFTFCNSSTYPAPQGWMAIENNPAVVGLNLGSATAQLLPSLTPLPVAYYTDGYGNLAVMVQVGNIPATSCNTQIRLTTTVNSNGCVTGNIPVNDFITVRYGNQCDGIAILSPDSTCQQGTTTAQFRRYPSALSLTVPPSGYPNTPVDLCDGVLPYNFIITSTNLGTVTQPTFSVNLPTGMSILNITFNYPYGSSNFYTYPAGTFDFGTVSNPGWNIFNNFPLLASPGLTGSGTAPFDQIGVSMTLQSSCSYNSTDYTFFHAGGISSCSTPLTPLPGQHRPNINNANPADSLGINVSYATSDAATGINCGNIATFTVTVTNNGSSANLHNDVVTVNIPGSPIIVNPGTGTLGVNTITWTIPTGTLPASPLGVQTFTFTLSLNGTLYCQNNLPVSAFVGYNETVNCTVSGGSCGISFTSDTVDTTINACCQCNLSLTTSSIKTSCDSSSDGMASVNVIGGTTPYTYLWSNGQTTSTAVNLAAGTYTITVTDANGCTATATVTVAPGSPIIVSISPSAPIICAGQSVTLCAGGATSYSWSNGALTACTTVSPSATTIYTVNGTNAAGCSGTASVTVKVIATPTVTVSPGSQTLCAGVPATICASGASTYVWSNSATTNCISVTPPVGTNTFSVVGYNGSCPGTAVTATVNVLPAPALCMTPSPITICSGECVKISGKCTPSAPLISYNWSPTTGLSNPFSATTNACPLTTTVYTLTATNIFGCTSTGTVTVTVVPTPTISVTPLTQTICAGNSATICASGASTYLWSTSATTTCITVTPTVGTHTYSVVGYNGPCPGAVVTATVIVRPKPELCMTPSPITICEGECVKISGKCSPGNTPFISYSWSPSTGLSNPSNITTMACPTVTTVYTLTAVNIWGCSTNGTVTVNVLPTPTITVTPLTQTVCAGNSATICASGASTYSWSTGATSSCITVTPSVGTHTYSVVGYNGSCPGNELIATVVVRPKPSVCMTADVTICEGECTKISGKCTPAMPGVIYNWSPTTGLSNPANPTTWACPASTTVYTLTATNGFGCSTSGTVTVTVIPSSLNIVGPSLVACGSANTYSVSPVITSPPTFYSWTASGGTPSSGFGSSANISFSSPGGTITWYSTTFIGPHVVCSASGTKPVGCTQSGRIDMNNKESQNELLHIYPNPNNGNFTLDYKLAEGVKGKVILYNVLGEVMGVYQLSNSEGNMNISNTGLSDGTYIYKLFTDDNVVQTGKIIIMK